MMFEVKELNCWSVNYFRKFFVSGEVLEDWKIRNLVWRVKRKRGEVENYRVVRIIFILGNKFEMIFMDEFNDIFGEV